ncbi:hypothetical protein, partial [Pseudoalteromonas sp. S1649]|uniref:hypothetical protein n=1 Tax=Pseudoalteromonas sp. S1649 TaxID=579508 RepID=UPI0014866E9F
MQNDWHFADLWDAYSVIFNSNTVGIIDRSEAIIVKPLPFVGNFVLWKMLQTTFRKCILHRCFQVASNLLRSSSIKSYNPAKYLEWLNFLEE